MIPLENDIVHRVNGMVLQFRENDTPNERCLVNGCLNTQCSIVQLVKQSRAHIVVDARPTDLARQKLGLWLWISFIRRKQLDILIMIVADLGFKNCFKIDVQINFTI